MHQEWGRLFNGAPANLPARARWKNDAAVSGNEAGGTDMTRELLLLMTAAQAQGFADRMRAAESGDGAAACELGDLYRVGVVVKS